MYALNSRRLPSTRYFVNYSAAREHAKALGLSRRQYRIIPTSSISQNQDSQTMEHKTSPSQHTAPVNAQSATLNLVPSWSEFGRIYIRLAESGECGAVRKLRLDAAGAFAAAHTLRVLTDTFSESQSQLMNQTLQAGLNGFVA